MPPISLSCRQCGDDINPARALLGYKTCLPCGEDAAKQARTHWCVAPMHKSNYMLITDPTLLAGLNNKGGLIK